jgi:hypothetical protein|tara:strand:- start:786 stop:1355 length:570 start_codon:yes stop_codon:yes gene_type:complete
MKTLKNTTVKKSDGERLPIVPGTYPAHVSAFHTAEYNDSIVFNLTYKIAPEAKQISIDKMSLENGELVNVTDTQGNKETMTASYMSGKEFKGTGVWLTPSPSHGEGWRNRRYQQVCENLGIVFEKADEETILGEIEEADVVGKPAIVKLAREEYEKDGETRFAWKIFQVYPWKEGKQLSSDEMGADVPF